MVCVSSISVLVSLFQTGKHESESIQSLQDNVKTRINGMSANIESINNAERKNSVTNQGHHACLDATNMNWDRLPLLN